MTIEELERRLRAQPDVLGAPCYAVLLPVVARADGLSLLFERRAATLSRQPSEVCFPGGRMECGETPAACALRETQEELGIAPADVRLIAPLHAQLSPGSALVHPFLAELSTAAAGRLTLCRAEVDEAFFVPLDFFRCTPPALYSCTTQTLTPADFPHAALGYPAGYPWQARAFDVPLWQHDGRAIWGLTARIVRDLLACTAEHFPPCPAQDCPTREE